MCSFMSSLRVVPALRIESRDASRFFHLAGPLLVATLEDDEAVVEEMSPVFEHLALELPPVPHNDLAVHVYPSLANATRTNLQDACQGDRGAWSRVPRDALQNFLPAVYQVRAAHAFCRSPRVKTRDGTVIAEELIAVPFNLEENVMTLGTILLIILVLLLIGAIPSWPHSKSWGYGPSGVLGLVLVVIVVLLLMGRI
jgi:hypothetical protein